MFFTTIGTTAAQSGPDYARELTCGIDRAFYNGAWLCAPPPTTPSEVYAFLLNQAYANVDRQCFTGQMKSLPATNSITGAVMYDVPYWTTSPEEKPANTQCVPYLTLPFGSSCKSWYKTSTCDNQAWCVLHGPPAKIDADGDGYQKCLVAGTNVAGNQAPFTAEQAQLLGTKGCDCNEIPFDCNDSDKDIQLSTTPYFSDVVSQVVAIRPYAPGQDISKKNLNPLQPIAIEIKVKDPCVRDLDGQIWIDTGTGPAIILTLIHFTSNFDPALHPQIKPAPGTLVGVLGGAYDGGPYPDGWFAGARTQNAFETFLTQISTADSPSLTLSVGMAKKAIPLDLCVPVAGTGPNKIVVSRPINTKNFFKEWRIRSVYLATTVWDNVLKSFSPFKENLAQFSVYADLSPVSESAVRVNASGTTTLDIKGRFGCDPSAIRIFDSTLNKRAYADFETRRITSDDINTLRQESPALIGKDGTIEILSKFSSRFSTMIAHEIGHAFAKLRDEYDRYEWNPGRWPDAAWAATKNCAYDSDVPTVFPPPGNVVDKTRAICGYRGFYRSTIESMMNDENKMSKYNVVSCAWFMSTIYGQPYTKYYEICEKQYDSVIR